MSTTNEWHERSGHLTLGVMVRPLGAFPSGWRMPGAHADPADDAAALERLALSAEAAKLDYLYFGDWLSTGTDLELTDPHLLVRTEPLSTVAYLAAFTRHIGLIGTASVSHTEPFATARTASSIDLLSKGRFGLNLVIGSDPRASANFSARGPAGDGDRFEVADEYVGVVRGLWSSVHSALFTGDAENGALIDPDLMTALDHEGPHFSVAGPLNSLPPIQGDIPFAHAGGSPRSRSFAARTAELYLTTTSDLGEAITSYRDISLQASAAGRAQGDVRIVAPLLPIVASTRQRAFALYDTLVSLVPLEGDPGAPVRPRSAERTPGRITQLVGMPLSSRSLDDVVTAADAERFNASGRRLLGIVTKRSGRSVGARRAPTYRHLLVAQLVTTPIIVGSPSDIADHIETWYRASAVDGFTILSAYLHEQFETFADAVVPELRRRGLFRGDYEGTTLRDHLGSASPATPGPGTELHSQRLNQEAVHSD
ncbi:LLM class flavin-dependent oxidoreductase [soil metagenome]